MPKTDVKFDLIALGRAAVDFYGEQIGAPLEDMRSFAKYLGGCPANISVGAARLGLKPAMLTRVGDEHMGRFVRATLAAEGVDVGHVRTDPQRLTGLVVLGIRDRETFPLIFYRENCADMAVSPEDFDADFIASARALLVTGTHFSTPQVDTTSRAAIALARRAGTKVVLDIDYRPVLWGLTGRGEGELRFVASESVSAHLQSIVAECDLVVGTEEEIHIAGGSTDTFEALRRLRDLGDAVLVVKRGAQGCTIFPGPIPARFEDAVDCPGFPVDVFNILGAGDGFMAGLLRGWLRGEDWTRSAAIANACGALVVSRHGCAPAMPSFDELTDFLARADRSRRLHDDPRVAYLHRSTAGRVRRPRVFALAFDHRRQFEDLAARHAAPQDRISDFKRLVAEAVLAVPPQDGGGAIVDARYGEASLSLLTGTGRWIARPVEQPGSNPVAFEVGEDLTAALRAWPSEHVAKCLIHYHPDDPEPLRLGQTERLARLESACRANGLEWLLEIVPHWGGGDAGVVPRAVQQIYQAGLSPDWWKLPPLAHREDWVAVGGHVRRHDPYCQGVLVLGADSGTEALASAFRAAAAEPMVRGFAVGRDIFWDAAEQWFAGRIGRADAIGAIGRRYAEMVALWKGSEG